MQEQLTKLCSLARRHHDPARRDSAIPRVGIFVGTATTLPTPSLYKPMLGLILQGAKDIRIGDRRLRYDTASYFIASVDLPVSSCVIEASPAQPYVSVSMEIDRGGLAALLAEFDFPGGAPAAGFAVSPVTLQLLDSWHRMLCLLDTPEDIAVLAPMLEREIIYRLLRGPQGGVLRQAAIVDSRLAKIRTAIGWVRDHFDRPMRIDALADMAGMSLASFHRHFKAVTAMSPLQYQKSLRLQHARQLLIARDDAAHAAYAVGYESASQFSREYARMFGASPSRDAERLRGEAREIADAA
ncbi:AraC family transcriptional regulator [soil metagenome]